MQIEDKRTLRQRVSLVGGAVARTAALLCALLMLCALPLLFRNAFFDINRFKVQAVCAAVPPLAALYAVGRLLEGRRQGSAARAGRGAMLCMALLMLACVISCARAGFEESTLTGSSGRYCGLSFMLCCGAACAVIAFGLRDVRLLTVLLMLAASLCAVLGVLNAMGVDPLGFYARIRKGQESAFLSTIGNIDFFGAYMLMLLPVCAAQAIFPARAGMRRYGALCAVAVMLGAAVSRTDCAYAGVHLVCFLLLMLSGERLDAMARALCVWSAASACQYAARRLLYRGLYRPKFSGLPKLLTDYSRALILAGLLLAAALVCALLARRGVRAPGRRRLAAVGLALLLLIALAFAGTVVYFSSIDTKTPLGQLESVLRLGDDWGSHRGFVYARSLRAFGDYGWADRLFGRGMEQTLSILTPYCEESVIAVTGVFNDAHCQPLQLLLTCGILGAGAFLALYGASLLGAARRMGGSALMTGLLVSFAAYGLVMLLNVTQPILIGTYFSLIALSVACARRQEIRGNRQTNDKEGAPRES